MVARLCIGLRPALSSFTSPLPKGTRSRSRGEEEARSEWAETCRQPRDPRKRVRRLQGQALRANFRRAECRPAAQKRMRKRMAAEGFPQAKRERLEKLESSLTGDPVASDERQRQRMGDVRRLVDAAGRARRQALADPALDRTRQAFHQDLMGAMAETEPEAPEILETLHRTVRRYQRLKGEGSNPAP